MDDLSRIRSDNYVLLIAGKLWEELPQIIVGGLFFALLAAPVFILFSLGWVFSAIIVGVCTIAPGWAALLAYEFPLLRGRAARATHFWQSLRKYWWRSAGLGCLGAFPLLAALLKLPLLRLNEIPFSLWLSFAADFFAGGVIAALLLYAFPLLVRNDWQLGQTLRNSWLLMGRYLINTFGLLGMGILLGFAVSTISLGLLFLLPAVYGLFMVGNCEMVIQQQQVN